MNIITRRGLLLAVCLVVTLASAGDTVRLVPTFTQGARHNQYGGAWSVVAGDVDGDGRADLVACADEAPFAVQVQPDGTYATMWRGAAAGCSAAAVVDRNNDGGLDVITVSGTQLMIYDPRRLAGPVHTIKIPGANANATDVVAGNVDGDSAPEIVVVTSQATHVFDGATLELQWSATGYGGTTVDIGDIDGTTQREIVVSGPNGYILDAIAQDEKWGYVGGFGSGWDLGNVDADAKDEIVFPASSSQVTILNGDTYATSSLAAEAHSLVVGDANGDGVPEIFTAPKWGSRIVGYDPVTGAVLWTINSGSYDSTNNLGTANLDYDATPEVFWNVGSLHVGDTERPDFQWRAPLMSGPLTSATADLDGDGSIEFIVGVRSGSTESTTQGIASIEIRDLRSGAVEGTFAMPSVSYTTNLYALAVGQLDADPQLELAALVGSGGGHLVVWDSESRAVQFSNTTTAYLVGSGEDSFLIANLDADAVDEIVVATSSTILVLNGASNIIQKSLPRNNIYSHDFALADLNGDSTLELVIAHNESLAVYDTGTWTLLGSQTLGYPGANSVDATGADGGTVVVTLGSYYSPALRLFKGAALTPAYQCVMTSSPRTRFGEIAGEERLVVFENGLVSLYPLSADACPTIADGTFMTNNASGMVLVDATGDGRNELILHGGSFLTVALAGVSTEMRGDVDGDQVISVEDIDNTADYLFGARPDSTPSADVNADERISVDDLFQLINHELAGGAAPQP